MEKITKDHPAARSADIVADNIQRLKELFPEAVTEGRIDFEVLRQLLGDEVDERDEKYGLNWNGKRRARQLALTPSLGTLRPCPEESVDWDTTKNIFIEGDNLEVLKLLQKSYAGKVKLIYIDPPYNTGNDFVYKDDFQDNIKNYQRVIGARDSEGRAVEANVESSGRFHTDWLNMMYPRLKLARNLLREDGFIMVNIGQEELNNLISLCQDLFGEENYCGLFVWEKKKKPSFLNLNMGNVTDYIACFARNRSSSPALIAGKVEDGKKYPLNNAGNSLQVLEFSEGSVSFNMSDQVVQPQDMSEGNIITELLDPVKIRNGKNANVFRLKGEWRYSQATLDDLIRSGEEIRISKVPFRPNYIKRSGDTKKTANLLSHRINNVPTNEDATSELRELLGGDHFDYPKPVGLLSYLIRSCTNENDLIVDFFAGSGTTAHAIMLQNHQDGGQRRFILVQLPELLPEDTKKTFFKNGGAIQPISTIADLTKLRLRRASDNIEKSDRRSDDDLFGSPTSLNDRGFRIYRLDTSNIRAWNGEADDVEGQLDLHINHLVDGRTEQDVLYELLLKLGLDLCVPIQTKRITTEKTDKTEGVKAGSSSVPSVPSVVPPFEVHSVGGGVLMVCLATSIPTAHVEALGQGIVAWHAEQAPEGETQVVFRDSAFEDDVAKANMTAILEQNGIKTVRSL